MRWSSSPAFRLIAIGWYIALSIALGLGAGVWLDGKAATAPIFTLIGLFLGLAIALIGGYRMLVEVTMARRNGEDR